MSGNESIEVSVIIPTFHRELLVLEAVQSALDQTGVTIEVIVIDDSPEGSAKKPIESITDARLIYIKRAIPSDGSPALVRNDAWPKARGKYLHFLDDDDKLCEGALNALVKALEAHPSKGVAFGNIIPFGDDINSLKPEQDYFKLASKKAKHLYTNQLLVARLLFDSAILVNSACIIRKKCLPVLGGYDSNLPLWEDVEFYMRAIRRFGGIYLNSPVLLHRIHSVSLSHAAGVDQALNGVYRQIYSKYRSEHGIIEFAFLKILAKTLLKLPFFV